MRTLAITMAIMAAGPLLANGTQETDVAAYVWPSYHPDDRAKVFWPMGIGEWETVLSNKPKFPGHEQPRFPLWGFINEADPYVMEMEINAAADHGVNVFIFDWYWYDRMPYLEGCLNDGYLKARNNDRVKFYLMWANHDVRLIWDKRNADDAFNRVNNAILWDAALERSEFEKIARRWIAKYFSHPSYYTIDGKPVLMIYDVKQFIEGLGGIGPAREALGWFREEVRSAGLPGLELQLTMRKEYPRQFANLPGEPIASQKEVVERLGFDSLTHYQFTHITDVDRDYAEVVQDAAAEWDRFGEEYSASYVPHVSVGWDTSPRAETYTGRITTGNTPERFEGALRAADAFLDRHPDHPRLITVNSWNEWTETSYLQPCTLHGYGYLQAVKRVFLPESGSSE